MITEEWYRHRQQMRTYNRIQNIREIMRSRGFYSRLFGNLRGAHKIYIPFGEKIIVLKFELPWISIMPGKITLNFYLRGLLYKGGPKN